MLSYFNFNDTVASSRFKHVKFTENLNKDESKSTAHYQLSN